MRCLLPLVLSALVIPALALAEVKPTKTSPSCKTGVCPAKFSRGFSVTAGTVACMDEVSTSTKPEYLPIGTQVTWWADQTCACFVSFADPNFLSISMTTLEVTDAAGGANGSAGLVVDPAPDGSAGAVKMPASQRHVQIVPPPSARTTDPVVTMRTGACVNSGGSTNGRPCRVDNDCDGDSSTDGYTSCDVSADRTSWIGGGFFCCDCSSSAAVGAHTE